MKQLLCLILICALLFAALYVFGRPTEARTDVPLPRPGETASAQTPRPDGAVPASGTDLAIPEPFSEAARTALDGLRQAMTAQGCACALAHLGTVPAGEPLAAYLETSGLLAELAGADPTCAFLPELTPAHCADLGFAELYCLLPRDGDAAVCLRLGDALFQGTAGEPLLFTAAGDGVQVTVSPDVDFTLTVAADGTFAPQPGVLDFSDRMQ